MKLPIEWRPEARYDLLKARFWYDAERPGLGREFVAEVDTLLERIAEFPKLYSIAFADVRRTTVGRFSYTLSYREESGRIVVLGVLHVKRKPNILRRRLRGERKKS